MKDPNTFLNVQKGVTPQGYSKCESTRLCGGEQINDKLKAKYREEGNYRLMRQEPNFTKP
jgi:hypothetical protein